MITLILIINNLSYILIENCLQKQNKKLLSSRSFHAEKGEENSTKYFFADYELRMEKIAKEEPTS